MAQRDIVVVGASAGGVEALCQFVHSLPSRLDGSIFITVHFPPDGTIMLPRILRRAGQLPVDHPYDGEPIEAGRIYVARPNSHLLLERRRIRLASGPGDDGRRPAIDPMFRSAALAFGARVVGVVLTGNLDDGTSGLAAIKRRGGLALVQDPGDSLFPSMPHSAIAHVAIDRVVPIGDMWPVLQGLMNTPIEHRTLAIIPP